MSNQKIIVTFVAILSLGLVSCGGLANFGGFGQAGKESPRAVPVQSVQTEPVGKIPKKNVRRTDGRIAIGLLLPLDHQDPEIRNMAENLFNAAQLALFDLNRSDFVVIVKDTKGTPEGARLAARELLAENVAITIGPLFGTSVKAAAPLITEEDIPMVAFSNDAEAVQDGVWLLGFLPEQNIERVVIESIARGKRRIAALLPNDHFGHRVFLTLSEVVPQYGGEFVELEVYEGNTESMFAPAQRLAKYAQRRDELERRKRELAEVARSMVSIDTDPADVFDLLRDTAPDLVEAYETLERRETYGALPYDAVILPEGGLAVRTLAPLLPYFDVDPREVKFLGSGLWDDPSLGQEPPLRGGWFAAPSADGWNFFVRRYKRAYNSEPSRIASLAYDAVSMVGALITQDENNPFHPSYLMDPNGFIGVDGIFRLRPDGLNERGLAVMEVGARRNKLISPAPRNFIELEQYKQAARIQPAPTLAPSDGGGDTVRVQKMIATP